MFDRILSATLSREKISTTGVTQGNLELHLPPVSPNSHQTQITIKHNLGLTPSSHFLEGELIHWVAKAKNV